MEQIDIKYLLDEFELEKRKHHYFMKQAKKSLRNMMDIKYELQGIRDADC